MFAGLMYFDYISKSVYNVYTMWDGGGGLQRVYSVAGFLISNCQYM